LPRQAGRLVTHDDVEFPGSGVAQHALEAGALAEFVAGDAEVLVLGGDLVALAFAVRQHRRALAIRAVLLVRRGHSDVDGRAKLAVARMLLRHGDSSVTGSLCSGRRGANDAPPGRLVSRHGGKMPAPSMASRRSQRTRAAWCSLLGARKHENFGH